ncbi:hypothetical protein QQ045_031074 [Rhodiola kirilowii]
MVPIAPKAAHEEVVLVDWVWEQWKVGRVVDERMGEEFDENEVVKVLKLGLMCSNDSPSRRPEMRMVVRYLDGEAELPETLAADGSVSREFFQLSKFGLKTYTTSVYYDSATSAASVS